MILFPSIPTHLYYDQRTIRLFHGTADDYVPVGPWRACVERLRERGVDISPTGYPGAHHTYGNFRLPRRHAGLSVPASRLISTRSPCVELGPHVGYDEAAAAAPLHAVREFLTVTFRLTPAAP